MGIQVTCPNGHTLCVKDKYAGRQGYCPKCTGKVRIVIPEAVPDDSILDDFASSVLGDEPETKPRRRRRSRPSAEELGAEPANVVSGGSKPGSAWDSIDDVLAADLAATFGAKPAASTTGSMSLLGQSTIKHLRQRRCGELAPLWHARCKACGAYFED